MTSISATQELAALALAKRIAYLLSNAIEARGKATLVVSGGTTPKTFFEILSQVDLPWEQVTVIPSDERIVPADHPDRNERMIRQHLVKDRASRANLLSLVSQDAQDTDPERFSNEAMASITDRIDAVILGMGEDGHTASLFPNSPDITSALTSGGLTAVQRIPGLSMLRLSLTPRALLNSREVDLLLFGLAKSNVLAKAREPGTVEQYPVRCVVHQSQVPVTVYWAP